MKREINPKEFEFGIYEVYYDDNGKVNSWTEESLTPTCDSEEGLFIELELMKEAFKKEILLYS